MIYHYFDTSALVKAYVPESGSESVREILREARSRSAGRRVFVSRLAYPEAISAVIRRRDRREVDRKEAERVLLDVHEDFTTPGGPFGIIDPDASVVDHGARLVEKHGIRGFDAVHLSTALRVATALPEGETFRFAAADAKLLSAARVERLALLDLRP